MPFVPKAELLAKPPLVQFDERQVDLKKAKQFSKLMSIMRKKDPQYQIKLQALLNIKK